MLTEQAKIRWTTYFLGGTAASLVVASIIGQVMYYLPHHNSIQFILSTLFYVDREKNVPSTFSSLLLLLAAALLFGIALNHFKKNLKSGHWFVLAFGFAFMSVDEFFSLHERLIHPVQDILINVFNVERLGIFTFAWVIPGILVVLALIPYFWSFVKSLPPQARRNFILSASIFLAGAIGAEMVGSYVWELHHAQTFPYTIIATVEESLEMGGVIFFIRSLMIYRDEMRVNAITDSQAVEVL